MKTIDFTLFFFNGVTKYTLNSSINFKNKNVQLITEKKFLDQILEMRNKIFRITKRILVSHQEAEDATQEVISKLWGIDPEKRSSFKSLEAYSIAMAKNYCLDRLKSKQANSLSLDERIPFPDSSSLERKYILKTN